MSSLLCLSVLLLFFQCSRRACLLQPRKHLQACTFLRCLRDLETFACEQFLVSVSASFILPILGFFQCSELCVDVCVSVSVLAFLE